MNQRAAGVALIALGVVFGLVVPVVLLVVARDFLFNPFGAAGTFVAGLLAPVLPGWLIGIITKLLAIVLVLLVVPGLVIVEIWAERKVVARMQDRVGPNRVGPFGIFQSVADALKLLSKEDVVPARADRLLHLIAPVIVLGASMLVWAAIPWGPDIVIADLNVAVLYVIAVAGLPTLGILMGGWSSNNKYALLGGMRAAAQLISYEIPGVLAVMTPVLIAGSMSFRQIVEAQAERGWFIFWLPVGPIAFLLFVIAGLAEVNRTPFDLVEAESELTAGFHTEYSGMRFGLFFLAEFANVIAISAIGATLFLGGYLGVPVLDQVIPPYLWLFGKAVFLIFVMFWARGTLPRFRYDQLMDFAWKRLLPIALLNVGLTGVLVAVAQQLFPGLFSAR